MKFFQLMALVLGMLSAATSQAGYIFEVDPVNYTNIFPGQTVSTNIYVTATGADIPNFTSLAGVSFNLTGTGGTVSISSWTKNPLLFSGASAAPSGATLNQGPLAGFVTPSAGRALVGSISFTAISPGNTVFSFTDPGAGAVDNVSVQTPTGFTAVDGQVFTAASNFTVTAVPEPSTFALIGLAGVGAVAFRRFRKAKQA